MAERSNRRKRTAWRGAFVTLGLGVSLAGCGQQDPAPPAKTAAAPTPTQQQPAAPTGPTAQTAAPDARLHAPFKDAVVAEPPEGHYPLPQMKTGKSVGKLYEQVVGSWDAIKFVTPEGKRLRWTATIKTELGDIQVELWPDAAPNHVRNFIALAKAGYYDGLEFDRTVRQELESAKGSYFECLEAGCPAGTGDPLCGNLGYWLKPEPAGEPDEKLKAKLHHGEGTVGAWHAEEVETAGTKFYITLSKAPWMDGNWTIFGKVSGGLDVARKILTRPVRDDEFRDRPAAPVVMRSVTVSVNAE